MSTELSKSTDANGGGLLPPRQAGDGSGEVRLLTVEELAAWLRLTPKGIYCLVEARRLPFIKVSNRVRFLYADVVAWLRENRVPAFSEKTR